jgi:hypothetical protein
MQGRRVPPIAALHGGKCLSDQDDTPVRATAHLPGLTIDVLHRRSPDGEAEQMSINVQAVPSFEAFSRYLEEVNPFALWMQLVQIAWSPWLQPTRRAMLPWQGPLERQTISTERASRAQREGS